MNIKTLLRWLAYLFLLFTGVVIIAALFIRFFVFPNIDQYKDDIAQLASQTIERTITIGKIETGWRQLSPRASLRNVTIYDEQNRPALTLKRIDTQLSWLSLGLFKLKLSELTAHEPNLVIRRSKDGILYLAGVNLSGRDNPDFANWLLSQAKVGVSNASVTYLDELRLAPPLSLHQLNFSLKNNAWKSLLGRHEFSLSALPSLGTAQPILVDGHFIGRDMSNLKKWYGEIHTTLKQTELNAWQPWLDYPVQILSGTGDAETWLHFSALKIDSITTHLQVNNVSLQTAKQAKPLIIKQLSGQLGWSDHNNRQAVTAKNVHFSLSSGMQMQTASGAWAQSIKKGQPWIETKLSIQSMQLDAIKNTLQYFSIPAAWMRYVEGLAPSGKISKFHLVTAGNAQALASYSVAADFNQLSSLAYEQIPGFTRLSGNLKANENGGTLNLAASQASIDLKQVLRWPVPADQLNGQVIWKIAQDTLTVRAKELAISSPHLTGSVNVEYTHNPKLGDNLDLTGQFSQGNAKYALFYYPTSLGVDTLHWLDTSLLAGRVEDIQVRVKGRLADFPFVNSKHQPDPSLGIFKVTANMRDGLIEYGTGWPVITGLDSKMLFEGTRMLLNATKGNIAGNALLSSRIEIPQLDADAPMLRIDGELAGKVSDGIRFVNTSPVKEVALGFTDDLKTAGDAKLQLALRIPLQNVDAAKYTGAYQIINGTLLANEGLGLPELTNVNGTLNFTESGLSADRINTTLLGGPAQLNLNTNADKSIHATARGQLTAAGLQQLVSNPFTQSLQGSTEWSADIHINKPLTNIAIQSTLAGMAIHLPAPFNKAANTASRLVIEKTQSSATQDEISVQYAGLLSAKLARVASNGSFKLARGEIGINKPATMPSNQAVTINANLDQLDVDAWLAYFNQTASTQTSAQQHQAFDTAWIDQANVTVKALTIQNRLVDNISMLIKPMPSGLRASVQSPQIVGELEWQNANNGNNGKVIAHLKTLMIPNSKQPALASNKQEIKRLASQYPALDIQVDSFEIGNKKLGALALNAYENGDDWVIQSLTIQNPDNTLTAEGNWHNWTRSPNTFLKFNLQSNNIGKTLQRFGQPDAVKGGKATVSGQLKWPGSPHEFDAAGLSGQFKLEAEKGQIVKVQPGVGRLLGLLSLQSLPRRLTLDFRDLFSEGFAFDKISANATASNGILRSDDFFMTGPAAETYIKGETNLKTETQNLYVKVMPHISDSLSLAALAGGPIVGAAAFVAQKLLKDPLNKIASSEYRITGTWDKPQEVESKQENSQQSQ